ncbi:MAG: FKBP-type peptidyl-prolyl cis-trans isomerase [Prosthecobacter sp.]|uniref:FKBP-type peptidyl-prolyl cis-trans isomerase n=1 Tax=Prosthecobacter sp. TaxID=1965333 RepID=UPI0039003D8C
MIKSVQIILPSLLLLGCSETPQPKPRPAPVLPTSAAVAPAAPANVTVGSGMHTTASGLQYEVLQRGTGTVSPTATDTVRVHYHGTLLSGSVFDSSVERGEPISFPLNGVIRGWTEGVQLMKVGDKFRFVIPHHLAYGGSSPSAKIPPFSTLVFQIELLDINGSTN